MKAPGIPEDEKSRLIALRSLNILDTPEEERFDRLTRLAKRMFGVPIALVSLVDESRQWFKSCHGFGVRETPRDISFCGHTILGDKLFVIHDTKKDERFADNPLVIDTPNVRFYAGYPLKHMDGSKLGTLCIIDRKPRSLDAEDVEVFKDLAQLVEQELITSQLATLDELTKISNRRGFIVLAQKSLDICARQGVRTSLAFFDLDKFKLINDNFGHAEGDMVLKVFADHMKKSFRNSDVFARIDSDKFAVLLTDTPFEVAEKVIARFRKAIDAHNQEAQRGYNITFSDSVLAVNHGHDRWVDDVLKKAGELMFEKKRNSN
ncbi:MAG: sensor domain-containing diguanylate cyclase [Pseudomonadales bacterium]|nr:sensor domain-containing diguanylate cyclase [Pseudomonadales bacterium]